MLIEQPVLPNADPRVVDTDLPSAHARAVANICRRFHQIDPADYVDPGGVGVAIDVVGARRRADLLVDRLIDSEVARFDRPTQERLRHHVTTELFGFGIVDRLFAHDRVTDVVVNHDGSVWFERDRGLVQHTTILDRSAVDRLAERCMTACGRRADRLRPILEGVLVNGVRVTVVVAPVADSGPVLAFRRPTMAAPQLTDFGDEATVDHLRRLVDSRANVVVAGATGSGKTSLVRALVGAVDDDERVVVIEDTPEIEVDRSSIIRLVARSANGEGAGEVSMSALVRAALRLRPDRIVVGEVRGAEAYDMAWALSTGHSGSMSTCHAHDAAGALRRLTSFVLQGVPELRIDVADDHVKSAIDAIVIVRRLPDGRRGVCQIVERAPGDPRRGWQL